MNMQELPPAKVFPDTKVINAQPLPETIDEMLNSEGVMIKQLTSECCRCFCCQPNIHWTLHPYWGHNIDFNDPPDAKVWIQEDAAYCDRMWSCYSPGCRPTTYRTIHGVPDQNISAVADHDSVLTHSKGRTCGVNTIVGIDNNGNLVRCPMCCCLPYLSTTKGNVLQGTTRYLCDFCLFVPKYGVYDKMGSEVYRLRPDTCCFGCCVLCKCTCAKGGKCCRIPFLLRNPKTFKPVEMHGTSTDTEPAGITDLWAGFKNECCTKKNIYALKFPPDADQAMRATLIGSTLLVDITLYEQEYS